MLAAITEVTQALGVEHDLPAIWAVLRTPYGPEFMVDGSYPYRFPALDEVITSAFSESLIKRAPAELNELAALLMLAAAHTPPTPSTNFAAGGSAAYSLLHRMRGVVTRCDTQMNLGFLVSADLSPSPDVVVSELDRATELCQDSPVPLWLLGQFQIAQLCGDCSELSSAEVERRNAAPLETYRRLSQQFPGTPWGAAGTGETMLRLADLDQTTGVRPFTARQHYRLALEAFSQAAVISSDPAVVAGIARAQAGLRRFPEAASGMGAALALAPDDPVLQVLRIEVLERGRRYDLAVDELDTMQTPASPSGLHLVPMFAVDPEVGAPVALGDLGTQPVTIRVTTEGGTGAAAVEDLALIPEFVENDEETQVHGWCRAQSRLRDLVVAGRQDAAVALIREGVRKSEYLPGRNCYGSFPFATVEVGAWLNFPNYVAAIAAWEAGDRPGRDRWLSRDGSGSVAEYDISSAGDRRQNLWRWAGNLPQAEQAVREWMTELPADPLALDRLGEVQFLAGRPVEAIASFQSAVELFERSQRDDGPDTEFGVARMRTENAAFRARAKMGISFARAGDRVKAFDTLSDLADELAGMAHTGSRYDLDETQFYVLAQLGHLTLGESDWTAASDSYRRATVVARKIPANSPVHKGVVQNNLALAYSKLGASSEAAEQAAAAFAIDPANPIFAETLAYAERLDGDTDSALATYSAAIGKDPSLFTAHNNRGVLLALGGRSQEAIAEFRAALAIEPDYGTAWFNLGTELTRSGGPVQLLRAQGALGRAVVADHRFRNQRPELIFDDAVYRSGLDLSRPLSPDWNFDRSASQPVTGLGVLAVLLLIGHVTRSLGLDWLVGRFGRTFLSRPGKGDTRPRWWHQLPLWHPVWTAAVAVGVLVVPAAVRSEASGATLAVLSLGALSLIGLAARARDWAAKRYRATVSHFSWPPSMVLSAVLAIVQPCFVPLPPARVAGTTPLALRIRWAAPVSVGGAAALLMCSASTFGVPISRTLGVWAIAMFASLLIPVQPLDGGYLTNRRSEFAAGLLLLAATVAVTLKWI